MEAFLHYLWLHQSYEQLIPTGALAGAQIEVLDPGELNLHAGPDFFAARIRIDGLLWVGCVELHHAASEWFAHGHDQDPAYDSVILHVVEEDNRSVQRSSGDQMPTCLILVPKTPPAAQQALIHQLYTSNASAPLLELSTQERRILFSCLYRMRMQRKVRAAAQILARSDGDWNQCFYALLCRYFGGTLNGEALEQLAFSLPLHLLQKHSDHLEQVEALLLGQASLLSVLPDSDYRQFLEREYSFLRHKYELHPLPVGVVRRARARPANLPERRLLQLAQLLTEREFLSDQCLHLETRAELHQLLQLPKQAPSAEGHPGLAALTKSLCDLLIINVVLPYRVLYAQRLEGWMDAAPDLALLHTIPPEENRITRLYQTAGIELEDALDSQAILQLQLLYDQQHVP